MAYLEEIEYSEEETNYGNSGPNRCEGKYYKIFSSNPNEIFIGFTEFSKYIAEDFFSLWNGKDCICVWNTYRIPDGEFEEPTDCWFYNDQLNFVDKNGEKILYRICTDKGELKPKSKIYVFNSLYGWEPFAEYSGIKDFCENFVRDSFDRILLEGAADLEGQEKRIERLKVEYGLKFPETEEEKQIYKEKVFMYYDNSTSEFIEMNKGKLGSYYPHLDYELNCDGNRKYWPSGRIRVGGGRQSKRGDYTYLGFITKENVGYDIKVAYSQRRPMSWELAHEIYEMAAFMGPKEISTILFGIAIDDLTEDELGEFWELYNYGDSTGIRLISGAIYADAVIGAPRAREQFLEIKGLIQRENEERQRREAELNQEEDDGLYIVIEEKEGTEKTLENRNNVISITKEE